MTQEIKIKIKEEREGNALKETERDLERLERRGQKSSSATPRRISHEELEERYAKKDAATQQEQEDAKGATRNGEIKRTKETIASTKLEEEQMRAAGKTKEADALATEIKHLEKAVDLQKQLGVSHDEAYKLAKESVTAKGRINSQLDQEKAKQREITQEKRRQAAFEKAGVRTQTQMFSSTAQMMFGGGPSVGGMMTMGRGLMGGGMAAAGGVAAIAAIAYKLADITVKNADRDVALGHKITESRARDERSLNRDKGVFGSSSALVSGMLSSKETAEATLAARERIKHEGISNMSFLNPLRWADQTLGTENWKRGAGGFGWWKSDAGRADIENEQTHAQAQSDRRKRRDAAREKFLNEEGGLEMQIARGKSARTTEGLQSAREGELKLAFMQKWKQVAAESGDADLAKEAAGMEVKERMRELQLRASSGMVNINSGAADSLRASAMATSVLPDTARLHASLEKIDHTLKGQLGSLNETAGRESHF